MNILFVDDAVDILEGIVAGVNFQDIGIENIFLATSADRARNILRSEHIDIMVTDIDMPGENGLELLKWVRDYKNDLVTMFYTSYADFDYARQAIILQGFDYFLKPIAYEELQTRIEAAVKQADNLIQKQLKNNEYHNFLITSKVHRKNHFWNNILFKENTDFWKENIEHGLDYNESSKFTLCISSISDKEVLIQNWKKYAFINIAEDIILNNHGELEAVIQTSDVSWCFIFLGTSNDIREYCQKLFGYVRQYLSLSVNCYYSENIFPDKALDNFNLLFDIYKDDVTSEYSMYSLNEYKRKSGEYVSPCKPEWEAMLLAGKEDELIFSINSYIYNITKKGIVNREFLKAFRSDILQMIYVVLNQKQISAKELFLTEHFDALRDRSLDNVVAMVFYIENLIKKAAEYIRFVKRSQSIVDRVKNYISDHFNEDITLESIAKVVYLNTSYLTRLFRKETGQTIIDYIQHQRIEAAKKLLLHTDTTISEIAYQVGFNSPSYFAQVFRKQTGIKPVDYKNNQ